MSGMAEAKADREATPLETALQRLESVRNRLTEAVTRVLDAHSSIQATPESPEVSTPSPGAPGSSDLVRKLTNEAEEIELQTMRLCSFIGRSEVAA